MKYATAIRSILERAPSGLTPQQIRDAIKQIVGEVAVDEFDSEVAQLSAPVRVSTLLNPGQVNARTNCGPSTSIRSSAPISSAWRRSATHAAWAWMRLRRTIST